ncbi:tripartite motif-containing protein 72-like isoform X2 [Hemitrygon akajei]|uniref:tripartite motif-containing protein 72-like isoform X2 n=1 Tax=Hemitrygon akajei TaxID=2704970 RepID=UPI003BF97501
MEASASAATLEAGRCAEHSKKLAYFCKQEKLRVCSKCAILGSHQGHPVVPVAEALSELKDLLSVCSEELESKCLKQNLRLEEIDRSVTKTKEEADALQHQVEDDFDTLRRFLDAEEKALKEQISAEAQGVLQELSKLRMECLQKVGGLSGLAKPLHSAMQIDNLSEILKVLDISSDGSSCSSGTVNEPIVRFKSEKFLGPLQYKVWKKMFQVIQTVPEDFTFDPLTSHPHLEVSPNQRTVITRREALPVPYADGRFDTCLCVLGWVINPFLNTCNEELTGRMEEELISLRNDLRRKLRFEKSFRDFWMQKEITAYYPVLVEKRSRHSLLPFQHHSQWSTDSVQSANFFQGNESDCELLI